MTAFIYVHGVSAAWKINKFSPIYAHNDHVMATQQQHAYL